MNDIDTPLPLNTDVVIEHIYQGQADLKILAEWLAYEAQPELPERLLWSLAMLRVSLSSLTPSHSRH